MAALSCALQVCPADILDDVGVAPADILKRDGRPGNRDGFLLEGFILSDAHAAEIESVQSDPRAGYFPDSLDRYYEDRGDFDKALATAGGLDKVRLLVRAGRAAEAPAVFTGKMVAELSEANERRATELLQQACRPLENAGAWDALKEFLAVVEGKLPTPSWRVAVWSEELDVAWHLDQVPKLLDEAVIQDPFKRCVIDSRLGNRRESEALAASLVAKADPTRLLEMMEILRGSEVLETAGIDLWNRADLPVPQRQQLWRLLDGMMIRNDFAVFFSDWIEKGGDAAPLAALVWESWIRWLPEDSVRKPVVEKLVRRYPAEPRFAILLGRILLESNPERALELFEKATRGAFVKVPRLEPFQWNFTDIRSIPKAAVIDPVYVAIGCIGSMHRQDRIHALLEERKDFTSLPETDQARYLAAGGMDHEFFRVVLAADQLKPENDALAGFLVRVLKARAESRVIPPEILAKVARKLPELALGGTARTEHDVGTTARELFEVLIQNKVDPVLLKEATAHLMEGAGKRAPDLPKAVGFWLRTTSRGAPAYRDVVPPEEESPQAKPVERTSERLEAEKTLEKAMEFKQVLEIFKIPGIRRIGSGWAVENSRRQRMSSMPGLGRYPIAGLDRWFDSIPERIPPLDGEMVAQVMRSLGKDHPRRLVAEILITTGTINCGDEGLKEEAAASVQALMEGKTESRGTELFRLLSLAGEGRDADDLVPVLDEVVKLPPVLQTAFLRGAADGLRQSSIPIGVVYEFLVNPVVAKERKGRGGDDAEARLMTLANGNRLDGKAALELAEQVLDRQLVGAMARRGGMMGRGFDPRRRSMGPMREADGQTVAKIALEALKKAGKLQDWRERAAAKLEILGMLPPEIKRWIDGLEGVPSERAQGTPGTKTLNPNQASVLLREALNKRDADGILTLFGGLSDGRLQIIADAMYLEALGRERAEALFQAITDKPLTGASPGPDQVGLIHYYFQSVDPSLASGFRGWLAAQKNFQFAKESVWPIVDQLMQAGARKEAIDLIVKPFVVQTEKSGEAWAFPPKQGNKGHPREDRRAVTVYEGDIAVLVKWDLLDAAIKMMEEIGDIPPLEIATLKMAKDPTAKTFETEVLPPLAELDEMIRFNLVSQWETTFKEQANASDLRIRLLEEGTYRRERDASSMAFSIREVSGIPGSSAMIARVWHRLLTEIKEGQRKDDAADAARRLVPAMALAADDETWKSYWSWRSSDPEAIGELQEFSLQGGMEEAVPPERAKQVMKRAMEEINLIGDPDTALGWVATVLATGEQDLVKAVRTKLTGDAPEVVALCDQALGRTAGIFPLLSAGRLAGGEVELAWNLVTYDSRQPDPEVRDVPLAGIPAMNGKFDLKILGGKEADQLTPLEQVPTAPNSGKIKVKVPEGVKYFALGFTEVGTKDPRKTQAIELEENEGLIPLPGEADLAAKGMTRKREAGPGGLPAYQVHLGHHGDVEVANLEWTGGESLLFDAWISGGGNLEVEFLDEKGQAIERRKEDPMDSFRVAWQKRGIKLDAAGIPARTSRLRFSYHGTRQVEGAHYFSVAGARILRSAASALPEGFEKVGRIPGRPLAVTLSPDGRRMALGMEDGRLVIIDSESGKVAGSYLEPSLVPQPSRSAITDVRWFGDVIHAVDNKGRLRRFAPSTMAETEVRRFQDSGRGLSMYVSRDGKWLAVWSGQQELLLIPSEGGATREISLADKIAVLPRPEGLYFVKEPRKWELLKIEDFAQGVPVEAAIPRGSDGSEAPTEILDHPLWKGRLQLAAPFPLRSQVDGREVVSVPVSREVAVDPKDGTLYYADRTGNIVRVKP